MLSRFFLTVLVLALTLFSLADSLADSSPPTDLIKVEVADLIPDGKDRTVMLVLRPEREAVERMAIARNRVLPLVIGTEEARSIYVAFYKHIAPRPLSHDLMNKIIGEYGGKVASVVISRIERNVFYAELRLKRDGREIALDCRPSDAIALALRTNAPVYVHRLVMQQEGVDPNNPEKRQNTEKTLKT
jgi:bifunctional DNase/RNase